MLAVAAAVVALPAGATGGPGAGDEIAYLGNGSVYLVKANGKDRRQLIPGGDLDLRIDNWGDLAWSPDGGQIAFTVGDSTTSPASLRIYLAAADGSNVRALAHGADYGAYNPSWSPDGARIAFTKDDANEKGTRIATINVDGTGLRTVAVTHRDEQKVWAPDWSPNGRWILYDAKLGGSTRLMAVHPDGSGQHAIGTFTSGRYCLCGDWSPDGSKIAIEATMTPGNDKPELYVLDADGSNEVRLTRNHARDENPDWSPDGKRIAFYSERRGNAEIYVISSSGGQAHRVTRDPWYSDCPQWRPRRPRTSVLPRGYTALPLLTGYSSANPNTTTTTAATTTRARAPYVTLRYGVEPSTVSRIELFRADDGHWRRLAGHLSRAADTSILLGMLEPRVRFVAGDYRLRIAGDRLATTTVVLRVRP